jgi:hypothetical protein
MRPILASPVFLLGSAIVLLFASGCGQDEGGRCQIDSDCASGLTCHNGETGNGTCVSNAGELADAAVREDVSLPPALEVQSQADTQPAAEDTVELAPELDTGTPADGGAALLSDASGSESGLQSGSIDGQAIDSL